MYWPRRPAICSFRAGCFRRTLGVYLKIPPYFLKCVERTASCPSYEWGQVKPTRVLPKEKTHAFL